LGGPNRRDYWKDLDVGGSITLRWTPKEMGIDGANWIRIAQGRVQWWAFVNTVMNLGVHKGSRLLFERLSDYKLFKEYPEPWSKYQEQQ
jgi:hypothetical protein